MTEMRFAFPMDGVMLTETAGKKTAAGLEIVPLINALPGRKLSVNGIPLVHEANVYHAAAPLTLKSGRNSVVLLDGDTGERRAIDVWYLPDAYMKYRFSLDDNIWFLQDLAKHKNDYASLFENPWLSLLKKLHDEYGTKFHLNIYYECPEFGGFDLTMMPDKWKGEWAANSDWMRLSCHANANEPDHPYIMADYNRTYREFTRVNEQILRFAGEEAFADKVTTIHWGDATSEAVRAVRDAGYRCMVGSFKYGDPASTPIAYDLSAEKCSLLNTYGLFFDKDQDMMYFKYGSGCLQHGALDQIPVRASEIERQIPMYRFRELCVHEEYFYPHYVNYMPDYPERLATGIRWCVEHGYEASFATEAFGL